MPVLENDAVHNLAALYTSLGVPRGLARVVMHGHIVVCHHEAAASRTTAIANGGLLRREGVGHVQRQSCFRCHSASCLCNRWCTLFNVMSNVKPSMSNVSSITFDK